MRAILVNMPLPFPMGAPRSEGVHVSAIIRSIAAETGILDAKWVDELSLVEIEGSGERWWNALDEVSKLRMSLGLAWEQWYFPQLTNAVGIIHQPGEMCVESIYMTHDGESLDFVMTSRGPRNQIVLHECKLTYKSTNTVGDMSIPMKKGKISPNWMWETQTKCYCKGLSEKYRSPVTIAYLHVLHICGDYSYPMSPLRHIWRIEYDQAEVDETWELIVEHLRDARAEMVGMDFDGRE